MTNPFNASREPGSPDFITHKLLTGDFWSTGQYFSSIGFGNTKKLLIKNPADSGVILAIVGPKISEENGIRIGKVFNASIDTAGDSPTTGITNKNSGFVNYSSVAEVQVGGDNETGVFSGGTSFSDKQEGTSSGGGGQRIPGSSGASGVTNLVYPGDNVVLELENISSDNNYRGSIDADFVELTKAEVESF